MLETVPKQPRLEGTSQRIRRRRVLAVAGALALLAVVALAAGTLSWRAAPGPAPAAQGAPAPTTTATVQPPSRPTPTASPGPTVVPTFDRAAHSIDDPASIWVVVNKRRPLNPLNYVPADLVDVPVPHTYSPQLRKEASDGVVALFNAASTEAGLALASNSAYRSYDIQVDLYNRDVAEHGQAAADLSTARPGTSEHQTGLTIDIGAVSRNCSLNACFGETPEGQWLAANAWRFGFLLRYPADKTAVTGYEFEPWHYRYIGVDLATEMHNTGVTTLEEFFGLPAAPTYG
jgi:D-alanyl-D-alanine carboxypeptidase